MFIGRKEELKLLDSKLKSDGYEMGVIYGQRRIGKTSILLEATRSYRHLYLLAREDNYSNNLRYFSEEYQKFSNLPYSPDFPSFDSFFDSIYSSLGNEKLVIVIDELPFLANAYPGIVSYLQSFCDRCSNEGKNIKLLLSGSNMSFMLDLLTNKAKPLYQRATFKLFVKPMVFSEAIQMLSKASNVDKAKYLSIFGNRPYYLAKIDESKSFEENIISLCFDSSSILIDAPNMTLPLGFSKNSTYVAILVAIASRKKTVKEIASSLRMETNVLSIYLKRMIETSALEKRTAFNGSTKNVYYEISDPFIRFYYRLIYPNALDIDRGLGASIYRASLPVIDDIIDHGFEDVAISYMDEQNALGRLPEVFHAFQNYRADNSPLGRSVEIDLISDSLDGKTLIAGEVKFRNKDVSLECLEHLRETVSIFAKNYKDVYYIVFSKKGFAGSLLNLHDPKVELISLDVMMGGETVTAI